MYFYKLKVLRNIKLGSRNDTLSRGFTIIELLVVIAIISLLAGIIMFNVSNVRTRARDQQRLGDLRAIQNKISRFYAVNHRYPEPDPDGALSECNYWDVGNTGSSDPFIPELEGIGYFSRNPREQTQFTASSEVCHAYNYGYKKITPSNDAICSPGKPIYILTVLFEQTKSQMGLPEYEIDANCCGSEFAGDVCANPYRFGTLFKSE